MKKLIMGGVLVLTMIATQVTPASAKTYTRSVQLGGAKGQYITYTLDTAARRNLVFPLNFVYHDKGKADGAFSSSLTKGDEFGVEASITYNMDAYFAGVEVSAGGATLAALEAGAHVTHVDASKGMVAWAKENAASSGLADRPVRWLVDDCVKFVEREIRRGNHYDGIIMDPPSYGRGPKGETWKIEESIFPFVELCTKILSDNPLFFLINSYTTGLQPAVLNYMINTAIVPKFGGKVEAEEIGLPVSSNGLVLPCGASGRWSK